MNTSIRTSRDLWAGLLYLAFGVVGLYFGSGYRMGTAAAMGPGYFPLILSSLLVLLGVISLARAYLLQSEPVSSPAWRAMAIILGSIAAFALLLERAGLLISLAVLIIGAASASSHFKLGVKPLIGAALLIAANALVFVYYLRVPLPLLGSWFGS